MAGSNDSGFRKFAVISVSLNARVVTGQSARVAGPTIRKVLILIPGGLTNGEWTKRWSQRSEREGYALIILPLPHKILYLLAIITGIGLRKILETKIKEINNIVRKNGSKQISIAAHSFGTNMLRDILKLGVSRRFRSIFLMGSLVKRGDSAIFSNSAQLVVCDCSTSDRLACALHATMPHRFEMTSVLGLDAGHNNVKYRRFSGGHSVCVSEDHFVEFVAPIILTNSYYRPEDFPDIAHSDHIILYIRLAGTALVVLSVVSVWASGRF